MGIYNKIKLIPNLEINKSFRKFNGLHLKVAHILSHILKVAYLTHFIKLHVKAQVNKKPERGKARKCLFVYTLIPKPATLNFKLKHKRK
jgi:hypothetical protein